MGRPVVGFHFPTFTSCWSRLRSGGSRITARRVKVAVAVAALLAAMLIAAGTTLKRRAARFRALAARYDRPLPWDSAYHSGHEGGRTYYYDHGRELSDRESALYEWHARLKKKYLDASLRPWLPVAPDPPRP